MRHRHRWVEQRRTFVAPPSRVVKLEYATENLMREFVLGVTTVEDRCVECNELRTTKIVGNAT